MPLKEKMKTYTEHFSPMCWFRKHSSVWIALFASVILVLCYWKFGSYCWETNDDAFLAGISYGYHGSYDSHLIYINTLYGRLLNCFQSLLPSIPWYLIVEYGILVGSIGALFYLVLERWRGWTGILPIAVFVAFFAGYFLGFLQYTKVAGIASAAGILLLFHGVEKKLACLSYCSFAFMVGILSQKDGVFNAACAVVWCGSIRTVVFGTRKRVW